MATDIQVNQDPLGEEITPEIEKLCKELEDCDPGSVRFEGSPKAVADLFKVMHASAQLRDEVYRLATKLLHAKAVLNRFDCHECAASSVKADEIGCCATCGSDCDVYVNGELVQGPTIEMKNSMVAMTKLTHEAIRSQADVENPEALIATMDRFMKRLADDRPTIARAVRQEDVASWCASAFGHAHASSIPQRGIRLAEEAIEAAQAAGCDQAMVHKLVDYVYARPKGELAQELGGIGVTLLALAAAAGLSADDEEAREVERVRGIPLEHFTARNAAKDAAGFNTSTEGPK